MQASSTDIKARYLFFWLVISALVAVLTLGVSGLGSGDAEGPSGVLWNAGLIWILYGCLFGVTVLHARAAGLGIGPAYGKLPPMRDSARIALVAVPMIGIAFFTVYIVFAPLSLVWPEFVDWWLFEDAPEFYSAGPPYPLVANILGLTAVTLAAPLVEEWFFRGLLLRRWAHKWGTISGVIGSSMVFALAHVDIVGAFVFGVAMCGLTARYRSLWPATIVHIANNAIVGVLAVLVGHGLLPADMTLEQFRAAWWLAVVGAAAAVPWLIRVRKVWPRIDSWRFGPEQLSSPG